MTPLVVYVPPSPSSKRSEVKCISVYELNVNKSKFRELVGRSGRVGEGEGEGEEKEEERGVGGEGRGSEKREERRGRWQRGEGGGR